MNTNTNLYFSPAVRELNSRDLVQRVRKEKPVCFLLVTSGSDDQLDNKVKVCLGTICTCHPCFWLHSSIIVRQSAKMRSRQSILDDIIVMNVWSVMTVSCSLFLSYRTSIQKQPKKASPKLISIPWTRHFSLRYSLCITSMRKIIQTYGCDTGLITLRNQ